MRSAPSTPVMDVDGAQDAHVSHRVPRIPQELLERPISLRTGIGAAHDAIGTRSPKAQAYYDQGLAYLHSYAWLEAARSFNEALRLDSRLALPRVGLSYAYIELNEPAAARAALAEAQAKARQAGDHERRHVELRALQMTAESTPGDPSLLDGYRRALDEALVKHPSDVELWLLRGVAAAPHPADRGQGGTPESISFYQRALAIVPDHFAAHHYLTHAYENSGRVDDALRHGQRYARLSPAIPHAQHMHGHSLRRVGRIREALAAFQRAHALETDPARVADVPPEYDWHHQHNLDLLATSHQYVGQIRKAEPLLRRSFEIQSALVVQEFTKHEWPALLLALGRRAEALEAAQSMASHPSPVVSAIGHVMKGHAFIALSRMREAADASNDALRALRRTGQEGGLAAPHLQALQAEFFLSTGSREKAMTLLREVRRKIRALPGPDGWSRGLFQLEAIGRAAVAAEAWNVASETAEDMRSHDPAYAGTHYLIGLVAEQKRDLATARREYDLAARAWREADDDFPPLVDVRKRLATLRTKFKIQNSKFKQ